MRKIALKKKKKKKKRKENSKNISNLNRRSSEATKIITIILHSEYLSPVIDISYNYPILYC